MSDGSGDRTKGNPLSRRDMLRLAGASVTTALVGCGSDRGESLDTLAIGTAGSRPVAVPSCIVRPEQTEGPYFVDETMRRSDIRSDPSGGAVKPGAPLRLVFNVSRVDGESCEPLPDAVVDVWQCDALGTYSAFRDFAGHFDTREERFLRGYQVTDADGRAEFTTIYPGWYPGRAVHIHFKIRMGPESESGGREFTSQLYFDDELNARVHTREPYASHGPPPATNADDGIFRRGGDELMLDVMEEGEGFAATFAIGLRT